MIAKGKMGKEKERGKSTVSINPQKPPHDSLPPSRHTMPFPLSPPSQPLHNSTSLLSQEPRIKPLVRDSVSMLSRQTRRLWRKCCVRDDHVFFGFYAQGL